MSTFLTISKWTATALVALAFVKYFILPWAPPLYARYRAWVTRTASGTPKA